MTKLSVVFLNLHTVRTITLSVSAFGTQQILLYTVVGKKARLLKAAELFAEPMEFKLQDKF
eukprot:scaffold957_cov322-Pavlova_lutheri.AAC.12